MRRVGGVISSEPVSAATLSPVFIWAPTARCGVTLLQRLITSSREVLVFGEDTFLTNMLPMAIATYSGERKDSNEARKRLASGDYRFWSSAAHPDTQLYVQGLYQALSGVISVYETSARAEGFKRWGVKEPNPNWDAVNFYATVFPRSKHLFVYRHIEDVMRSYKSRGWLKTIDDVRNTATQWAVNMENILANRSSPRACVIQYEELLSGREKECQRIREYLEITAFDMSVFDTKVNTFASVESPKSEYVAPTALAVEERDAMYGACGEALRAAGYERK